MIKQSEANKQQQINEAEGQAAAILAVATATLVVPANLSGLASIVTMAISVARQSNEKPQA